MRPTVIDLRARQLPGTLLAIVVIGSIAGIAGYAVVTDQVLGPPVNRVIAGVLAGLFGIVPLIGFLALPVMLRPRRLVIDHDGIRIENGTRSDAFRLAWNELAGVGLLVKYGRRHRSLFPQVRTSLELEPADDATRRRHPELDLAWRLGRQQVWRVPLGPSLSKPPPIAEVLQYWRPQLWRGQRSNRAIW